MSPRRRWRYDETTGETIEETPPDPVPAADEIEALRLKQEQDERDAHPGNYI